MKIVNTIKEWFKRIGQKDVDTNERILQLESHVTTLEARGARDAKLFHIQIQNLADRAYVVGVGLDRLEVRLAWLENQKLSVKKPKSKKGTK